ncbi:MAG: HEAT repeat domain-containing protein [Phycisphaerae bacterium]|nr:HEAT repeat domain-containing protein [Phycisphaerae bacterium]
MSKVTVILMVWACFLLIGGNGFCQEAENAVAEIAQDNLDTQLKINRDALLKGTSDQIRMDAAGVMLFSSDPAARQILLDILNGGENKEAIAAVLKALGDTRRTKSSVRNKEEFIEPIVKLMDSENGEEGKLAAETTLIFDYEQISTVFEGILNDQAASVQLKVNTVYALKLQPDMRAIFRLIELLDNQEIDVALAAEKALQSIGIQLAGKDDESRKRMINDLRRKGRDEFLRDWLIRQETEVSRLQNEASKWRQKYLASLDKLYTNLKEDDARGQFILEYLKDPEADVRLLALNKVEEWRKSTNPKTMPTNLLGQVLIDMVSDTDKQIRLKTAQILSLIAELNSSPKLLEQLKVEQDSQIRLNQLKALGAAVHYASNPDSGMKVDPNTRKEALSLAEEFLNKTDSLAAREGTDVIRKLLERNGLGKQEVSRYFDMITKRYDAAEDTSLRAAILNSMALLCVQSVYKEQAGKTFGQLFEQAISDTDAGVREAAANGLIYIDSPGALKIFRERLTDDSDERISKKMIELASNVGAADDLVWLAEKVNTAQAKGAWDAMLTIFRRSDPVIITEWIEKLSQNGGNPVKVTDEQMLVFLEIAERKTEGANNTKLNEKIRRMTADAGFRTGNYELAVKNLGLLVTNAASADEKEGIVSEMFDIYVKMGNIKAAADLVHNCLLEKDLEQNSILCQAIERNINGQADSEKLLKAIRQIQVPNRPQWYSFLARWQPHPLPADANTSVAPEK